MMLDDAGKVRYLETAVITLTGGRDVSGNLLLTIPTSKLGDLSVWSIGELSSLFLHLATISKYVKSLEENPQGASQNIRLACLADLRQASTLTIRQLVESLESVERQHRGTISVVYFLKPRNKTKSHTLKKFLGVKPSKKTPKYPLFKTVLVKTLQELYAHIDVSQLTLDFSGTLQYSHNAWMHLYKVVIKCIESSQDLLSKLPSVRDKVDLLQESEPDGQSSGQLQQLLADLMEKFHIIISESSLPLCLTKSKQTLFLLDNPASDDQLASVHPKLVKDLASHLRDLYTKLDKWNIDLEGAWRVTESKLTVLIQVQRHRERAKEIERKICEHYHPLLREHPIVGRTLSQAELYRAHFTTTLYEPAKELLSQATEILEAVQRLKNSGSVPLTTVGHEGTHIGDINHVDFSDISKCLTTSIQPFTSQLQHLQQLYVTIHIFHLLFEKALSWYKKVLKFLPESLLQRCTTDSDMTSGDFLPYNLSPHAKECHVYMPTEWLGAVRVFLSRHPPPRQEHVDRLDESIPQLVDRKLRAQARSLALRLRLLQRVLSSTRLPLRLITAVMAWKKELFGASQQDKSPTSYHPVPPFRDRHKASVGNSTEATLNQDMDRKLFSVRGTSKSPDKTMKGKRTANFDQDVPSKAKSNSFHLGKTQATAITGDIKMPEKSPGKKAAGKMMLRAKSVDFNFNSSSTDGSVFDYEKAVTGLHRESQTHAAGGADTPRAKSNPRKSRNLTKDQGLANFRNRWEEDQAVSDPSEILKGDTRNMRDKGVSKLYEDRTDSESKFGSKEGRMDEDVEAFHGPKPSPRTSTLNTQKNSSLKLRTHEDMTKPPPLSSDFQTSTPDERFICLTFTPKQKSFSARPAFRYGSLTDLQQRSNDSKCEDEEESGIDTAEGIDPYDNIVRRIREISSSGLTNMEKLKHVSELLSQSDLKKRNANKPSENELSAAKFFHSTMDLRPKEFSVAGEENRNSREHESLPVRSNYTHSLEREERPVDVVQRMKRNLAKSMEELNTIGPYSTESHLYQPTEHHSKLGVKNVGGSRYRSELKIQPVYSKPGDVNKVITITNTNNRKDSTSEVGSSKNMSEVRSNDERSRYQSWSDVESSERGVNHRLPDDYFPHKVNTVARIESDNPDQRLDEFITAARISERKNDTSLHDLHGENLPEDKITSPSRPSSLSLFSNRNFISPSFLRPASSMRELSTTGHPAMGFELLQDMDPETDYQALEDMEMLRNLQEDPLSNEFSKFNVEKQFQQRKSSESLNSKADEEHLKTSNNTLHSKSLSCIESQARKTEEDESISAIQTKSENYLNARPQPKPSPRLSLSRKKNTPTAQVFLNQVTQAVPDIKTTLYSEQPQSADVFEEDLEEDLRYLHDKSPDFDRLTTEADQEYLSQEEVADSLRKTQRILEEEENRMRNPIQHVSDGSFEDEDRQGALSNPRVLNHTTSIDNGYGSWASKLVSALSTSSEGAAQDLDCSPDRDWRKLSTSSVDSTSKQMKLGKDADDDEEYEELYSGDVVTDLNWFDKTLTDPDLY